MRIWKNSSITLICQVTPIRKKHIIARFVFFIPILFAFGSLNAQEVVTADSVVLQEKINGDSLQEKPHSPTRATIYSMILPGLGQAYNRKYWKIPIIYAGFGTLAYFIKTNNDEYQLYREAYAHVLSNDTVGPPVNEYETKYSEDALRAGRNYYRRNRDLSYILTGIWYILNVIDATVDAHLYNWNISEDLTLRFEPLMERPIYVSNRFTGFRLVLNF